MKLRMPKLTLPQSTYRADYPSHASARSTSEPRCRCSVCSYRSAFEVLRQR